MRTANRCQADSSNKRFFSTTANFQKQQADDENRENHSLSDIRELKQNTTTTAMRTPTNKRFNEQNNGSARALYIFVHFFAALTKQEREMTNGFCVVCANGDG